MTILFQVKILVKIQLILGQTILFLTSVVNCWRGGRECFEHSEACLVHVQLFLPESQ